MDFVESLGFFTGNEADRTSADLAAQRERLLAHVSLKLIANGLPSPFQNGTESNQDAERLVGSYHQRLKRLDVLRCPVDQRIETFLEQFQESPDEPLKLPDRTVVLSRHGIARELSLPINGDRFSNSLVESYRVRNGVLHNPRFDRRTTAGTFHVAEGGLPIPRDKKAVPIVAFARLFRAAMNPPEESLELPFTSESDSPASTFVSLMLRPMVCPEVPGVIQKKSLEIRFFVPGSLVSNLDFVESIFGNGGDPFLPENDSALDVEHWTGHTGCVILAPHLSTMTKKELGLPHFDDATDRQREDSMCWKSEDELYNDGTPFKLTCRSAEGVIVTLIADNYFGYCKKEVKTQISFSANLYGNTEEEHAGGAIAFRSFNLGQELDVSDRHSTRRTIDDLKADYSSLIDFDDDQGYGVDRTHPNVIYIPENSRATVRQQQISWTRDGEEKSIPLLPENTYVTPAGFKVRLKKHPTAPTWRLIGTLAEGVFCHKPCTVSGGGKSEISKSLIDYVLYGPIFVADLQRDLDLVETIFKRDYSDRWNPEGSFQPDYEKTPTRTVLDAKRSLGSVIKLLTPSVDYTNEYNEWLESIPSYIYALVFIIKRFHSGDENENWRDHFSVDVVNGTLGHELKYKGRTLVGDYLRVGLLDENSWRTYKLRQDFAASDKIQTEDDISASVVVPTRCLSHLGDHIAAAGSYKFVKNCEYRLFQRPDDAVHRGLDKQTEKDLARSDNFIVNFEPLSREQVSDICDRVVDLNEFTAPMQQLLQEARSSDAGYVVCSADPRMIDGKPSKNPRYLQNRPDLMNATETYVAEMGIRLFRAIPADQPVHIPVQAVLVGRRNNPPDYARGFRPLAVYNPLHYQELPELFMDYISALTGKSPSTTGAGSEGALTKGPFNAVLPITDLNNALVSYLLTGLAGFSTPAGHIGHEIQVDHDISLLIPEIWCRLTAEERDPQFLIDQQLLERVEDFEHKGNTIKGSRLGYRINSRFIRRFVGRVFDNPRKVFEESILQPESQDLDAYADGINYICEAHERVAKNYFEDGSVEQACPPLVALLNIMAHGEYEGKDLSDPSIREMFTLESMLASDWYAERLRTKQERDVMLWKRHLQSLEDFRKQPEFSLEAEQIDIDARLKVARNELNRVSSDAYLEELSGWLGADPMTTRS